MYVFGSQNLCSQIFFFIIIIRYNCLLKTTSLMGKKRPKKKTREYSDY